MKAVAVLLVAAAGLQLAAAQSFSSTGGKASSGTTGRSDGAGSSYSKDAASGVGDPIFTGFDGRTFEFFGKVGSTYNLLSERNHQLSTRLKFAHMWDHNGTYMEAFSLRYRQHTVEVALAEGDALDVVVDGKPLVMLPSEVETEHIFGLAEGELQLVWQLHKAQYGNAVDISSELLQLLVWVTPAGTVDEGGVEQPGYLNFDLKLLSAPLDGEMQGVIGHTFAELEGDVEDANDWGFHHEAAEYEMAGFADAAHEHNLFRHAAGGAARRLLRTLPLRASARGAKPQGAAADARATRAFPLVAAGRGATRASAGKAGPARG